MSITIKVNGLWNDTLSILEGMMCLETQWIKSKSVNIRPTLENVISMKFLLYNMKKAVIQLDKKPIREVKEGGGESQKCILITQIKQRQWKKIHLAQPADTGLIQTANKTHRAMKISWSFWVSKYGSGINTYVKETNKKKK